MKVLIISVLLLFSILSCKKDVELGIENLVGRWSDPIYSDSLITLGKIKRSKDSYQITFMSDGGLIERKNAGWCGTPPISYADFAGSWSLVDSTITINVGYWGGDANYKWQIVSIDNTHLIVKVLNQEYNWTNGI